MTTARPDPSLAHRCGTVAITVLDADGRPLANRQVVVEQGAHAFRFGNIGFDLIRLANADTDPPLSPFGGAFPQQARRLVDLWFELFNTATLPFYWAAFEPQRGQPGTAPLHRAARWLADRGCQVKGHPLVSHTLTADWPGRIATVRLAFAEARTTDPSVTLILNDFDMSTAHECLIEGVLEAGIRVDALGLQSPRHRGYWGEEKTLAILDRFSRYGLPIHMTETTLMSGPPHAR